MTTYRDAGVNIDAGDETLHRIKPLVRQTFTPGVLTDIGAFGGFFQVDFQAYHDPVLVSSIDGVGTKVKVAILANRHDTIGEDLVNHCVNDIAVCGAQPLFFLDYYATGKLHPDVATAIIQGVVRGCKNNACALIGGETAEMPDVYQTSDYDLAGTIVGIVDKAAILDGSRVQAGDRLLGLPSTGLHTNGYSLARKVLFEHFSLDDRPEILGGESVAEALLKVHRSYLRPIQSLIQADLAHAFAHITGGGIPGNLPRVIPSHLSYSIDWTAWEPPAIFKLIQQVGEVPEEDMRRTFNMGIGLIAIVPAHQLHKAMELLTQLGESPIEIGEILHSS